MFASVEQWQDSRTDDMMGDSQNRCDGWEEWGLEMGLE